MKGIESQLGKKYETKKPLADENCDMKMLLEEIIRGPWDIEDRVPSQGLKELHSEIRHFLELEVETELGLLAPPDMAGATQG